MKPDFYRFVSFGLMIDGIPQWTLRSFVRYYLGYYFFILSSSILYISLLIKQKENTVFAATN